MAKTNPRAKEPFDPSRLFLVVRPLLINGKPLSMGEPLDKNWVPIRRLRQLYEQSFIRMGPKPDVNTMSDSALRALLQERGVFPRRNWDRKRLLAEVEGNRGIAA